MAAPLSNDQFSLYPQSVSNGTLDPFQGFDVDVWIQNQADGQPVLLGRFTSLTMTVRNATEAYMEFYQRVPRYLDGEFQIAWVMERGLLDLRVLSESFGFDFVTRAQRIRRSPRFIITFQTLAQDLDASRIDAPPQNQQFNKNSLGQASFLPAGQGVGFIGIGGNPAEQRSRGTRSTNARIRLEFCKVDSWNMAAASGRNVVANQWQGVSEGYSIIAKQQSDKFDGAADTTKYSDARIYNGSDGRIATF